jgi:hypothetical protein
MGEINQITEVTVWIELSIYSRENFASHKLSRKATGCEMLSLASMKRVATNLNYEVIVKISLSLLRTYSLTAFFLDLA